MFPIRILIADDHAHAREGIREILHMVKEFEIVGEAINGLDAIRLTEELMPDLILMDIQMPEMDGLKATKVIKSRFPYVKIIIITVSDEITHLFEALKQGAQGYLIKNIQPSAWTEYIQSVAMDEVPMSKEFAFRILKELSNKGEELHQKNPLSAREREVLECVAQGYTNREIAESLTISEYTVKNHLKNIMQKLHLENRVQLTRYAYEQGWI